MANGVVYYDAGGVEQFQPAQVVVLASNGVGTPRVLLNSISSQFPDGLANRSGRGLLLIGNNGVVGADFDFELIEAITGTLANPVDLLCRRGGQARGHAVRPQHPRPVVEVEADDVRLLAGETENLLAAAAYHQRWPG